jgi:hypothetical protein
VPSNVNPASMPGLAPLSTAKRIRRRPAANAAATIRNAMDIPIFFLVLVKFILSILLRGERNNALR